MRVNLLADFEYRLAGDAKPRTYSAGVRNLPVEAAQAARAAGLLGPLPKAPSPPRAAAPKAAVAKPAPAKRAARRSRAKGKA